MVDGQKSKVSGREDQWEWGQQEEQPQEWEWPGQDGAAGQDGEEVGGANTESRFSREVEPQEGQEAGREGVTSASKSRPQDLQRYSKRGTAGLRRQTSARAARRVSADWTPTKSRTLAPSRKTAR